MKIKNSKVIFPDKTKYKIDYSDEIVDLIVGVRIKNLFEYFLNNSTNKFFLVVAKG
jgi:hypothetical protein